MSYNNRRIFHPPSTLSNIFSTQMISMIYETRLTYRILTRKGFFSLTLTLVN